MYIGGTNGQPPVPVPPKISIFKMPAKKHKFKVGGKDILVKGDKKEDADGNKISVSDVSGKMKIV